MVTGRLEDLAVFGGRPQFTEPLHVGRPNIGDRRKLFERLNAVLERRWLTNDGPLVPEFESRIAQCAGVEYCIAASNATAALGLTLRVLGMTGDVIVPSFTFVAPVHALKWLGATPVFCDVDPNTHLLNPTEVQRLITPRTTGILSVHIWGQAQNRTALQNIASLSGLPLIFDAAQAFGSSDSGKPVGDAGNAEIFSFHATKIVNTFEGGAVVTNDAVLARALRAARNFGYDADGRVSCVGINAKMSEAAAAMGLTSLESLDSFADVNRANYERYVHGLAGLAGITPRSMESMDGTTFHYVVLEIDDQIAGFSRDLVLVVLAAEGILARRYFHPGCHRLEPYASALVADLPATDRVCGRVMQLPTGTGISAEDIDIICDLMHCICENAALLRDHVDRSCARLL